MAEVRNKKKQDDVYGKLQLYIRDGEFSFNVEDQPTVSEFEVVIQEKATLMCECLLNTAEHFPEKMKKSGEPYKNQREYLRDEEGYDGKKVDYKGRHPEWEKNGDEWLYCIAYDNHIVKIGMTEKAISERFDSYSCGTERAMKKGSCSTTNYIITECNFKALCLGMSVQVYGIRCPLELVEKTRFGITQVCRSSTVRSQEIMLTTAFKNQYGHLPALCVQTGSS